MFNPPNSVPNFSFDDVLKRLTRRIQQTDVEDRIIEALQETIEREFDKENVVLSRPERVRLLRQVALTVLNEAGEKMYQSK